MGHSNSTTTSACLFFFSSIQSVQRLTGRPPKRPSGSYLQTIIKGLSSCPLTPPKAMEHKLQTPNHSSACTRRRVIRARVFGFLLFLSPTDIMRAEIVSLTVSCGRDPALYDLGEICKRFLAVCA